MFSSQKSPPDPSMHDPLLNHSDGVVPASHTDNAIASEPTSGDASLAQGEVKTATSAAASNAVKPKRRGYLIALFSVVAGFVLAAGLWAPLDFLDDDENPLAPTLSAFASFMRGEDAAKRAAWQTQAGQYQNKDAALNKGQQQLVSFLAKKYRTATSEVRKMIAAAHKAGAHTKLDPLLILAVMSIESNLNPLVESPVGALGLMQIMPKVHAARFDAYGGLDSILSIDTNVLVGARILQDCIKIGGNTIEGGLKCYVGASGPSDGGYGAKVLAEHARLVRAAGGDFDFTPPKQDLELKPSTELIPIAKLEKTDDLQSTAPPAASVTSMAQPTAPSSASPIKTLTTSP